MRHDLHNGELPSLSSRAEQRSQSPAGIVLHQRYTNQLICVALQRRSGRDVQFKPEHTTLANRAFHADFSTHQFYQPLAQRKTDTRTFDAPGFSTEAIKRLKKLRALVRRQTFAGVPDLNAYPTWRASIALHLDRSAFFVVLDRVG